jgi:dTMP kinase
VLCDRFTDASFAYQGGGHGVAADKLRALEDFTHPGLQPDLTLLFDVSAEVGKARTSRVRSPDRFEREGAQFFARVRDAYLQRLRESNGRMVRIDGARAIGDIQQEVGERLGGLWKT